MEPYQTNEPKRASKAELVFKIFATVGFLAVILAVIWAGVLIIRNAGGVFNGLSATTATFLAFGDDEEDEGTTTGASTDGGSTTGGTGSSVPPFGGTTGGATSGTTGGTMPPPPPPPGGSSAGSGGAGATSRGSLTPGPQTTTSYTFGGGVTGPTSDPNGLPDLVPKVIAVGYIDEFSNEFVAAPSPALAYERKIAVKFEVENKGTRHSNEWLMNVVIPTTPHHIFHSNTLRNLYPGEKIEFVIAFTQANAGSVDVVINVDPFAVDTNSWGRVKESNEQNNILKHTFTIAN